MNSTEIINSGRVPCSGPLKVYGFSCLSDLSVFLSWILGTKAERSWFSAVFLVKVEKKTLPPTVASGHQPNKSPVWVKSELYNRTKSVSYCSVVHVKFFADVGQSCLFPRVLDLGCLDRLFPIHQRREQIRTERHKEQPTNSKPLHCLPQKISLTLRLPFRFARCAWRSSNRKTSWGFAHANMPFIGSKYCWHSWTYTLSQGHVDQSKFSTNASLFHNHS